MEKMWAGRFSKALDKEAAADSEELLERAVPGENPEEAGAL